MVVGDDDDDAAALLVLVLVLVLRPMTIAARCGGKEGRSSRCWPGFGLPRTWIRSAGNWTTS